MGQKVNPYGFRLGVTTDWKSRWFADREYADFVIEDWEVRNFIAELPHAAISRVELKGREIDYELTSILLARNRHRSQRG